MANGYLEVSDLVSQMISVHKFDMSNEEIMDIITKFGDQYLDMKDYCGRSVIKDKALTPVPNLPAYAHRLRLSTRPSGATLYAASEASVCPTEGQDVLVAGDVTGKARTRAQVMRCGLKFICAIGKTDIMQDGGVEFDAFVLALSGLENQVFNTVDAFVEAKEEAQFAIAKVDGKLYISDLSPGDVPLLDE